MTLLNSRPALSYDAIISDPSQPKKSLPPPRIPVGDDIKPVIRKAFKAMTPILRPASCPLFNRRYTSHSAIPPITSTNRLASNTKDVLNNKSEDSPVRNSNVFQI